MNLEYAALTVPVVGPDGDALAPMRPARVRRYLNEGRAVVAASSPFTIRLLERKDEVIMNTPASPAFTDPMAPQQPMMQPGVPPMGMPTSPGLAPNMNRSPIGGQVPISPGMGVHGYRIESTLIKNVSGGPLKISDLKETKEDEGFQFGAGEVVDLRNFFHLDRILASRDLRRALFPEDGSVPKLQQLRSLDDPNAMAVTPEEMLRGRVEAEVKKPLEKLDSGRVSPGRAQLMTLRVRDKDQALDSDVQRVVNANNWADGRLREEIEREMNEDELVQQGELIE